MKRIICYLAVLMLVILPVMSSAECEHQVEQSEWVLIGYVDPLPGVPGYSGDLCCPLCGTVMQKGEPIDALPERDDKEEHGTEQEDPVPVPAPFNIGSEAPEAPAASGAAPSSQSPDEKAEREPFSEQYPFRRVQMEPEPGIVAPTAGELIWSPDMESDSENTFTAPNVIPAKGIEDFLGEWHYFRFVKEDGTEISREEMLAEGLVDDHAEITVTEDEIKLYSNSLGNVGTVKYEFNPDDGSLTIQNGTDLLPVLRLTDNGMLVLFVPASVTSSEGTTAYLTRWEP